jgi:glutathione S-transferase
MNDYPNVQAWMQRIGARPSAKVKIAEPADGQVTGAYPDEQFQRLFRPAPAT